MQVCLRREKPFNYPDLLEYKSFIAGNIKKVIQYLDNKKWRRRKLCEDDYTSEDRQNEFRPHNTCFNKMLHLECLRFHFFWEVKANNKKTPSHSPYSQK